MSVLKKIVFFVLSLSVFSLWYITQTGFAIPPTFDEFAQPLQEGWPDSEGRIESMFDFGIDPEVTLYENVRMLFYPQYGSGWYLWNIIRVLWFIVLVVFLVINWIMFLYNANDGEVAQKYGKNLAFILVWAALFFWAVWLVWVALDLDASGWSAWFFERVENNLLFQILTFLKSAAFFVAIIMLVVAWVKMLNPSGDETGGQAAWKAVLNVILALAFIKLVDFVFYIASSSTFIGQAQDLIVSIATVLLYILGSIFVFGMIYAWYVLITSWWDSSKFDKVKSVLVGIFLAAVVVFLFLLIMYQVVDEFA